MASPLLLRASSLGAVRKLLLENSVLHLAPTTTSNVAVPESLFIALLVVAAWAVIAAGLGAWRTVSMDA